MWLFSLSLVVWISLVSGNGVNNSYQSCYSSSSVEQYAFYYGINLSLPLEEGFAACNNRLTKYIGLRVDQRVPAYNVIYCGNDLINISPKVDGSRCHPCSENVNTTCGGVDAMSVYLLRESSPLAMLLATYRGVERLIDNSTTLLVAYTNNSENKFVDYIYTEDTIVSVIETKILRSFYNFYTMKYSQHYSIISNSYRSHSLAVDFNQSIAYYGYIRGSYLYKTNLKTTGQYSVLSRSYLPQQISVDPYNRTLVFVQYPYDTIYIYHLDKTSVYSHSSIHYDKINALTMNIQERLLYAILTLKGDSTIYLVSLDYMTFQMRVLFSGSNLVNATVLEVFGGEAIWLTNINNTSYISRCKLTPKCNPNNVTTYRSTQRIYDLKIYHPEKQTPGPKYLCKNMTCHHSCQAFTTFSARCICPPGMEMNPDNSTCYAQPTTTTMLATTLYRDFSSKGVNAITPGLALNSTVIQNKTGGNKLDDSDTSLFEVFVVVSIIIVLIVLVGLVALVLDLYRKNAKVTYVLEQRQELKEISNEYVDIDLLK